ncbi:MAG: hypothetical protein GY833_10700 [Aestuariibacter sp.]|nr:hypothetical protein [Aestuariibacter sp.]
MLERENENPTEMRTLSPWNPLDHLRLQWWVLVTPQRLVAYREVYGENAERSVGKWLVSTLIWLPFFISTLALGLGTMPLAEITYPPAIYLWTGASLILVWALTGWLGERDIDHTSTIKSIAVFLAFAVVGGVPFFVIGDVTFRVIGSVIFGVVLGVVPAIAKSVAGSIANILILGVSLGAVFIWIVMPDKNDALNNCILIASLLRSIDMGLDFVGKSLKTGDPSWLAQGYYGALVLAYIILVWFSFLGGWRVIV